MTDTRQSKAKSERNSAILADLKLGMTYADVGRKFNLTRERVRQIATREEFQYEIDTSKYMTVAEAAALSNLSITGLYYAIKGSRIKAIRVGQKWFIPRENYLARICAECGQNPIPTRRSKYCSKECYNKAHYKLEVKYSFRRWHRKQGKALPPSLR